MYVHHLFWQFAWYIVGFWLVEMAISTNQKPTIYRNLYENTGPAEKYYGYRTVASDRQAEQHHILGQPN